MTKTEKVALLLLACDNGHRQRFFCWLRHITGGDMPGFDILFRSMSDLAEGIISKDGNYTIS